MIFRVHPASGVPLYLQIESQVKHAIAANAVRRDDPLPPVRKMAADLRINPNTVARAFQNLERDGVIRTVPGGGTYVGNFASSGGSLLKVESIRRLRPLATQFVVEAARLGVPSEELHQLLDSTLQEFEKPRR